MADDYDDITALFDALVNELEAASGRLVESGRKQRMLRDQFLRDRQKRGNMPAGRSPRARRRKGRTAE